MTFLLDRGRRLLGVALALLVTAPALVHVFFEARVFLARVRYPMDIEWLEGPSLYQAYRSAHRLSTYGPPENGYLPLTHPPGYPVLLSLVDHLATLDYPVARTVSLLCWAVAAALVVREIRAHARSRLHGSTAGLLALGCIAAAVPLVEGACDLVRPDSLAIALAVGAAVVAMNRGPRLGNGALLLLAGLFAAIVYTRLPAVFFALWVGLFVFVRHRRSGLALAIVASALGGLVLVYLQFTSHGWYWMQTIEQLKKQDVSLGRLKEGLRLLHGFAPFAVALLPVALLLAALRKLSARAALWTGMLASALPASFLPYAKVGGFYNDLVPVGFLVGPAAAFLAIDVVRALERAPRAALAARWAFYLAAAGFLAVRATDARVTHDGRKLAPSAADYDKARALNALVKGLEGGVLVPRAPFLPVRNHDRAEQFSDMPYLDAAWSRDSHLSLGPYLEKVHARWAMLTGTEVYYTQGEIAERYQLERTLAGAPVPMMGEEVILRALFRWKDDDSGARVLFDFERPLVGWKATGDAFAGSPTLAHPPGQNRIPGVVGERVANSYHAVKGDTAVGTLTSPPFVIDRPRMGLRVGGGYRGGTRVDLLVDGRVAKTATGVFRESETMTRIVWDVTSLAGKAARLVLVDEDSGSWGHLTCDQVILYEYDLAEALTPRPLSPQRGKGRGSG